MALQVGLMGLSIALGIRVGLGQEIAVPKCNPAWYIDWFSIDDLKKTVITLPIVFHQ